MSLDIIPSDLRDKYQLQEWGHATGIMATDYPEEWSELLGCLSSFTLKKSAIVVGGGGRSKIPKELDGYLYSRGWSERQFDIKIVVDGKEYPTPTHAIDNFKNSIGVEVEWNNKTEFYDRDLNNFRLLYELRVMSVGVIITRSSSLQTLFKRLGIGLKYGASTTRNCSRVSVDE